VNRYRDWFEQAKRDLKRAQLDIHTELPQALAHNPFIQHAWAESLPLLPGDRD